MTPRPERARRVTMSDIAALARVHKSTVSLALRNQPSIPEHTRARIHKIAAKLRYRPDPVLTAFNAQRLSRQPTRRLTTFAFVTDLPDRRAFDASERHREILAGAAAYAERQKGRVELFFIGQNQLSSVRFNRILHTRAISGVIVGPLETSLATLTLDWTHLCGIAVEAPHISPALDQLATNYREAARLVVQKLHAATSARVGFLISADLSAAIEEQLRAGYLVELASRRTAAVLPFLRLGSNEIGAASHWFKTHRPNAVVCCGFTSIPSLPFRVRLASIDITRSHPQLPGVPAVHHALGQRAAEMLALRLRANLRGPPTRLSTTLLPVSWRETG
jgi:LacI family transcriptional regulator